MRGNGDFYSALPSAQDKIIFAYLPGNPLHSTPWGHPRKIPSWQGDPLPPPGLHVKASMGGLGGEHQTPFFIHPNPGWAVPVLFPFFSLDGLEAVDRFFFVEHFGNSQKQNLELGSRLTSPVTQRSNLKITASCTQPQRYMETQAPPAPSHPPPPTHI